MSAYCLFDNIDVRDPSGLADYVARVGPVVARYGGRYLAVGGTVDNVEGTAPLTYPVLIAFPDLDTARRWYDCEEYQPLKALRQRAVRGNAVFFEADPTDLVSEVA